MVKPETEGINPREGAEVGTALDDENGENSLSLNRLDDESEGISSQEDIRHNRHVMSIISDMLHGLLRRARHFSALSQDSSSAGEANGACLWVRRTFRQMDLPEGWVVRELASQVTINLEKIYIAQDRVVAVECRRPNEERHVTFEAAPIDKKEFIMAGVFVARVWTHNENDGGPAKEEVQFQVGSRVFLTRREPVHQIHQCRHSMLSITTLELSSLLGASTCQFQPETLLRSRFVWSMCPSLPGLDAENRDSQYRFRTRPFRCE